MSHYKSQKISHHTDPQDYIKPNGANLWYGYSLDNSTRHTTARYCKFKCRHSALQFAVDGTEHTENGVTSSQDKCPLSMTTSEYKGFGTLRSGECLQYHNIARALLMRSLDFCSRDVFVLVAQAIWQTEEPWDGNLLINLVIVDYFIVVLDILMGKGLQRPV